MCKNEPLVEMNVGTTVIFMRRNGECGEWRNLGPTKKN